MTFRMRTTRLAAACVLAASLAACAAPRPTPTPPPSAAGALPNVVLIYADDIGFGDLSSYGATRVLTPAADRLAAAGVRFSNGHAPAATCTPSRYAMLTGEYAWRQPGTGIARGDAPAIIQPGRTTLASLLKRAGYTTAVIGKWHLGLGPPEGADWNGAIKPGPLEIGFDHAFLMPATGDRVPTVWMEGHRVVGLDPADPIRVSFGDPIPGEPTGKERPDLLRVHPSHGHDQTIVDGISRIGYMSGGRAARWKDEEIADVITSRAVRFIEQRRAEPFFLFFSTHDIHVPRVPHPRFAGSTGMGPRGDAIAQFDWSVGQVLDALDRMGLAENTLVILTSDNGPVVDDGYQDQAVELLGDHRPAGPLRGGKYSAFEGGTRVPFIVRWPARVPAGATSDALISQVDLPATLAQLAGVTLQPGDAPDSQPLLPALLGQSHAGRDHLVEQGIGTLALVRGHWKYIEPTDRPAINRNTGTELGHSPTPQLYNLQSDLGERTNLAAEHPQRVTEMAEMLERIRAGGR